MSLQKLLVGLLGVLVVLLVVGALVSPTRVPANASTVSVSGSGDIVVTSVGRSDAYLVDGNKVTRLSARNPINVTGSALVKFVGEVKLAVGDGDIKLTLNDKAEIEVPARQKVVLDDKGKVTLFGILPRQFHVKNCVWVVAEGLARVTADGCERVDAFAKSRVYAKAAKVVTANTMASVSAENCEEVVANDATSVEAKGCKRVTARGTSKVAATGCDLIEATDESRIKPDDCKQVNIRDGAKKVFSLTLGF